MDKKMQKAILEYIKGVKEAARIDITKNINQTHGYSILDIKESINILEGDKKIRTIKKAPRDAMFDIFCLTRKGYESLKSWPKRILFWLRDNFFSIITITKK